MSTLAASKTKPGHGIFADTATWVEQMILFVLGLVAGAVVFGAGLYVLVDHQAAGTLAVLQLSSNFWGCVVTILTFGLLLYIAYVLLRAARTGSAILSLSSGNDFADSLDATVRLAVFVVAILIAHHFV